MDLFVDTSVWSLALRRDVGAAEPAVERLRVALESGEGVFTTGLVLQELLQGFHGPKARDAIVERFAALPLLVPIEPITSRPRSSGMPAAGRACRSAPSTRSSPSYAAGTSS